MVYELHAVCREPVCRLLAARGRVGLTVAEIAVALEFQAEAVRATLKYLYAHGRIGRRMEYYRVTVGNCVSHRQRRYRWFVCPEDDEGVQDIVDPVLKRGRAAERRDDRLPTEIVADQ